MPVLFYFSGLRCPACRTPKTLWPTIVNGLTHSMNGRTASTSVRSRSRRACSACGGGAPRSSPSNLDADPFEPQRLLEETSFFPLAEVRQLLDDTHEDRFSAPSGRHVCPGMGPGRWLRRRKDRDRTGCAARAHRLGHEGAAARLALTQDLPGRVAAGRVAKIRPQVSSIVQRRRFEQGRQARASPGVVPDPSGCVHGGSRYGGRTSSRLSSCSSRRTRTWSRQGRPSFHGSR